MATHKPKRGLPKRYMNECPSLVSPFQSELPNNNNVDTLPPVPPKIVVRRPSQGVAAKSAIETTLLKSVDILSEFTNTISQTSNYFNNILSPERFGFPTSRPILPSLETRPRSVVPIKTTNAGTGTGRKKPDLTKLPRNIVNILKADSNSSIPANKSKKHHYHSKKMALRQRDDCKGKNNTPLTPSAENIVPKIVVVSTPLELDESSNNREFDASTCQIKETADAKISTSALGKNDKKFGVTSVLRKPDKLNIGVENGVAFILGSKSKSPYFNTFGDSEEFYNGDNVSLNRKWVVNVGNFLDEEISLVLVENNLTITGFRQPSLHYPEGQSVSETIPLPQEFDINNLRLYRAKDAESFLVIQEKV